jgi:hypothetical protein
MSANERLEAAVMRGGSLEPTQVSARARALRRVPPLTPIEHIDGPDTRIADVARAVTARIASRPLTAAVLAVGLGFVVGGALSFRAGRAALAAAGRHILRELLKQVL